MQQVTLRATPCKQNPVGLAVAGFSLQDVTLRVTPCKENPHD